MSVFRRMSRDRRIEDTLPPLPLRRVSEMPPRPPMPAWTVQGGIHDVQFDPCGAPAIAVRKSGAST